MDNPATVGTNVMDWLDCYSITQALTAFEAVLGAELSLSPAYLVTQKAGFDTAILIENGMACFPNDLWVKAPDAVADLQQATKCLAFEVFTAAGFHFHRANESVLRHYWNVVSGGKPQPGSRTIGAFIHEMDTLGVGNLKVKAALKDLKDLHRNPLIHPEHSIETMDEAIALMNGIHNVVTHMLVEIPKVAPTPTAPGISSTAATTNILQATPLGAVTTP